MHTENYDPLTNFIRDLSKASTDGYKDLVLFFTKNYNGLHTHTHTKLRNKMSNNKIKYGSQIC